jgi:hypothetical protein
MSSSLAQVPVVIGLVAIPLAIFLGLFLLAYYAAVVDPIDKLRRQQARRLRRIARRAQSATIAPVISE